MEDTHLKVEEQEDGSWIISWEDDHPFASIFATWTEEDWIEAIRVGNERAKAERNGQ